MIGNRFPTIKNRIFINMIFLLTLIIMMIVIFVVGRDIFTSPQKTPEQQETIYVADSEGFAIINPTINDILSEGLKVNSRDEIINYFPLGSKLILKDNEYYMESEDIKIKLDMNYPLFTNDGAYLYLYNDGFTLVNDRLDSKGIKKGSYISGGALFNADKISDSDENIILLKLSNGLFFSLEEISIEIWNTVIDIPLHSLILWDRSSISYINIYNDTMTVNQADISDATAMINYSDQKISYSLFYEGLNNPVKKLERVNKLLIKEELYQYYMSYKYIYSGDKVFHRISNGYYMEFDGGRYIISEDPLYMTDNKKIVLPADYLLVQPKLYLMSRASALSEITIDEHAVYITSGDNQTSHTDIFLFNGDSKYIFFDNSELYWSDTTITLSPLSTVIVEGNGTVEIYDYDNDDYLVYEADGYEEIHVKTESGIIVNLSKDIMYRADRQELILFNNPSLLEEIK